MASALLGLGQGLGCAAEPWIVRPSVDFLAVDLEFKDEHICDEIKAEVDVLCIDMAALP